MHTSMPVMSPAPGERLQRYVGDRVVLTMKDGHGGAKGWHAVLRTNLGRGEVLRREILQAHTQGLPLAGASWRDIPMREHEGGWRLDLPLTEVGFFKAKAYLRDPRGWQHWPQGPDVGISVHPDAYRTANTIYCAFTRMFGASRTAATTRDDQLSRAVKPLDQEGFSVIPPSGKLRDLTRHLSHIFNDLGCRILHLLPVNPTPTTFARFGRFGSPYAALDLTAIDPALVVFDRRTTGVDQFKELTYETHLRGGRVFLDIVINHTGWGSLLQETHPEWFLRDSQGNFVSPGAWGNTWEDLVEIKHEYVALWDELAEMFLTWTRRGVDGFRCDAGYKVPVQAWQYIIARVQQEYPETLFLLEGLGGAWEATEALLTEGGMQWAYSELFQNYSPVEVSGYLDHSFCQTERVGLLVHYSETHDNARLAARGRQWSLLRNRLCALASVSGGFGFTCGVEWLAAEKVVVHESSGMRWGDADNIMPELKALNTLLAEHPCFFDGAKVVRLSAPESPVLALRRESGDGKDWVLVLVNTDVERCHGFVLEDRFAEGVNHPASHAQDHHHEHRRQPHFDFAGLSDLLGQKAPQFRRGAGAGQTTVELEPGTAYCLALVRSERPDPSLRAGDNYRQSRARAAWGIVALNELLPLEKIGALDWQELACQVDASPANFLTAVSRLATGAEKDDGGEILNPEALRLALSEVEKWNVFPHVVRWGMVDLRRVTPVPPSHWLLVEDTNPFRATLAFNCGATPVNRESINADGKHIVCFPPQLKGGKATLRLERYAENDRYVEAVLRYLGSGPGPLMNGAPRPGQGIDRPLSLTSPLGLSPSDVVLLTNGRGAMARFCVDLGRVQSKYDCVLGANLHPTLPVDRHILAKRIRVWVSADGFISPLDFQSLAGFDPGPPAIWDFVANAGDGRTVQIQMHASMVAGKNATVFHFSRPSVAQAAGKQLPPEADVRLSVRLDLEDRGFHGETKRSGGAEHHFNTHTHSLAREQGSHASQVGFAFTPAKDRQLRVFANRGSYHAQPEWSENIPHPVEQSRAQVGGGDAFSPGWFELPLASGETVTLVLNAEPGELVPSEVESADFRIGKPAGNATQSSSSAMTKAGSSKAAGRETDHFGDYLRRSAEAFVVQRGEGKTVIAGYPWFLDWGRDTFISARGLLAAGLTSEVSQIVATFARFEQAGTLPNTIFGEDASNRDTSDAPLWFGVVCEELAALTGGERVYKQTVSPGRTLLNVLESIAAHYASGTPNGIRMDAESGLIWSPSHFTWMDTNYPACTPREGYPIEIQVLWIRLLRQLERVGGAASKPRWAALADQAMASLEKRFWLEEKGWYSDLLIAKPGQPAKDAVVDDSLRSNMFFAISLGLVRGTRARRCVEAGLRYLAVPGGLRSLAPLRVDVPLPNAGNDGRMLNDPHLPYWGRYEGDEDTRRKPAYHNGTVWTWTFPGFCEALAMAWDCSPEALATAKALLGSMDSVLAEGCIGHLPEILDGDAPHLQRGCDAQAWSATEALRVWKRLNP